MLTLEGFLISAQGIAYTIRMFTKDPSNADLPIDLELIFRLSKQALDSVILVIGLILFMIYVSKIA